MRKRILLYLFLGVPFLLAAQPEIDSAFTRTARYLKENCMGYSQLNEACASIGHRLTGSKQGQKAESLIFDHLKKRGVQTVQYDPFPFRAWKRKTCKLEIVPYKSDNYVGFEAVSLANTPSFRSACLLIDGADGLASDLRKLGSAIKGKCLVVNLGLTRTDSNRQNLHRAEKVSLALEFGAAAVMFVHPVNSDIRLTGTASLTGEVVSIPAICVSGSDGKLIRDWMKSERLMADMDVQNEVENGFARNVVARIDAADKTNETIIFCAHLDCWDLGTGSVDNGIGSFALLDIAASLQRERQNLKRNVVIIWTMGEEQGLLGSRHFVRTLKSVGALSDIRAVVNMDMVGNPVAFNDFDWPGGNHWFEAAQKKITPFVPAFSKSTIHDAGLHSDHQPFMLEGIPVFSLVASLPDSVYRCYHANCDLMNLVRPDDMKTSAMVHSFTALKLAMDPKIPFKAMNEKKLVKWLKKHNLKEKLEISKEWRWN
jgi:carboxypeptidase Q